jgi:hypothetical protein
VISLPLTVKVSALDVPDLTERIFVSLTVIFASIVVVEFAGMF